MKITFIPLQDQHLSLLLKWLETPHVKAWWDSDVQWTSELIKEKYGSYVHGYKVDHGIKKPMHAFIIAVDDQKIGYIQLYNAHTYKRDDGLFPEGLPSSLAGIDIFIGEVQYRGKGYGSEIIKQFLAEHVDPFFESCFIDPDITNLRAIRAYENAGFVKMNTVMKGKVVWMVRGKPERDL